MRSLPDFGEGGVGLFLACSLPLADPTRPRYRSATLPEAGEGQCLARLLSKNTYNSDL
jgi:hypothetical protein